MRPSVKYHIILALVAWFSVSSVKELVDASAIYNEKRFIWATVNPSTPAAKDTWVPLSELVKLFLKTNPRSDWYADSNNVLRSPPAPRVLGFNINAYYVYQHSETNSVLGIAELYTNGIRIFSDDNVYMSPSIPKNASFFTLNGFNYERLVVRTLEEIGDAEYYGKPEAPVPPPRRPSDYDRHDEATEIDDSIYRDSPTRSPRRSRAASTLMREESLAELLSGVNEMDHREVSASQWSKQKSEGASKNRASDSYYASHSSSYDDYW